MHLPRPLRVLRNAGLPGGDRADIVLSGEVVERICAAGTAEAPGDAAELDLTGYVLMTAAADPHAHLDKSRTWDRISPAFGDLPSAVAQYAAYADAETRDSIAERARTTALDMLAHGVTAVRSHANFLSGDDPLRGVDALLQVREELRGLMDIELCTLGDDTVSDALHEEAIARGVDLIGGAPHLADDPSAELDRLLTLAERLGCGVDMHTDESLDGPLTILQLAERTARWTHAAASAGHCSRLGTLAEHELAPVVDAVLAADLGIITLPMTNLYLQGWDTPVSTPRGITAVRALLDAGRPIEVPEAETAAFAREAYPRLRRSGPVFAPPDLVLPEPDPTTLVVSVVFHEHDALDYRLQWLRDGTARAPWSTHVDGDDHEALLRAAVGKAWGSAPELEFAGEASLSGVDAAEFVTHVLAALEQTPGVRVDTRGRRREYRELLGDPRITVKTVETDDHDWFDLGFLVEIDGRSIPFRPLFTALALRRKKLLLTDGSYFSLAHPGLDRLRALLDEAAELAEWEAGPRISRYQLPLWEDFEDLADEALPAVAWRTAARELGAAGDLVATPPPAGLDARLRPYQQEGLDRLALWWRHRLGGVLADDMGLGKTLQVLALLLHARETGERRPVLVVAPTSVLGTWHDEAARFAPGLDVTVRGTTTAKGGPLPVDADVVVTSYTVLRLDDEAFAAVDWAIVVLDEAQFVKNPRTRLHRAVEALRADMVLAVTGTPLENSLTELWAILSLTCPGLFASPRRFREDYVKPIEQGKVPENEEGGPYRERRLERLRARLRPFVLRRTKELVAPELPERQEQELRVELSPAHRAVYDTVLQRERQKVLRLLADLDSNRFIVFRSLTLLRMLALAPALVDAGDTGIPSSKLDALRERLRELIAEGHRALVFSQFTSYLDLVRADLDAHGIAYEYLDGSTRRRADVIDAFRRGDAPVFLISLKAGGFGLTLTEADYVFLMDPWWNPAAEAQAIDRTHRIGQTRPVNVYRMIAAGTIEEKVVALQQRKARLFTAVLGEGDALAQSLTADDIRGLLES